MDFDQLHTFLEVARTLNFSQAAKRCFRTQPAVSAQIRALEEEVGAKLFNRTGGKVSITAAGIAFKAYAEQVLDGKKTLLSTVADLENETRGELAIAANEATCLHILPGVFAAFKNQCPDVSVNIRRSERAAILEQVIGNSVDFGIVSTPVEDARLQSIVIHQDHIIVITEAGHPLSWLKTASAEDIASYPLLLPKMGRTRNAIEDFFAKRRLNYKISMELDSSELLKRFVAAGVGVGFIASSNVNGDVKAKALSAIPLEGEPILRAIALVFRKDRSLSRAAKAFMVIIQNVGALNEMK